MSRPVVNALDRYQRERLVFAQAALDFTRQPENVETLVAGGAISLLQHLSQDVSPGIQHLATLALGRLATHSQEVAESLVTGDFQHFLVNKVRATLNEAQTRGSSPEQQIRRAAALCLKGLTRHSEALAERAVSGSGAVEVMVAALKDRDTDTQEAAAWVLGNMAGHSAKLATMVADAAAVVPLAACLSSGELAVKRIAASALSDIAKHGVELAQRLVEAGAVEQLVATLRSPTGKDMRLRRQACCALGQIAKASPELASKVLQRGGLAEFQRCLAAEDAVARRHAALALRDVAKLAQGCAQTMADRGCLSALVAALGPGEQMYVRQQ
ncbi:hypothetical protein N2152v2_010822 [Parachlorella kessleri]